MSAAGAALAASKIAAATSQGIGGWMQMHAYGGALNRCAACDVDNRTIAAGHEASLNEG